MPAFCIQKVSGSKGIIYKDNRKKVRAKNICTKKVRAKKIST